MYAFLEDWKNICIDGVRVINLSIIKEDMEPLDGFDSRIPIFQNNLDKYIVHFENGIDVELPYGFSDDEAYRQLKRMFKEINGPPNEFMDGGLFTTNIQPIREVRGPISSEFTLKTKNGSDLDEWFKEAVVGQANTPELRTMVTEVLRDSVGRLVSEKEIPLDKLIFNVELDGENTTLEDATVFITQPFADKRNVKVEKEPEVKKLDVDNSIDRFEDILDEDD